MWRAIVIWERIQPVFTPFPLPPALGRILLAIFQSGCVYRHTTASLIPAFPPNRQTAAKASSFFLHGDQAPHFHLISASTSPVPHPLLHVELVISFLFSHFSPLPPAVHNPFQSFRGKYQCVMVSSFLPSLPLLLSTPFLWWLPNLCSSWLFKHIPLSSPSNSLSCSSLWPKRCDDAEEGGRRKGPSMSSLLLRLRALPALGFMWEKMNLQHQPLPVSQSQGGQAHRALQDNPQHLLLLLLEPSQGVLYWQAGFTHR